MYYYLSLKKITIPYSSKISSCQVTFPGPFMYLQRISVCLFAKNVDVFPRRAGTSSNGLSSLQFPGMKLCENGSSLSRRLFVKDGRRVRRKLCNAQAAITTAIALLGVRQIVVRNTRHLKNFDKHVYDKNWESFKIISFIKM